MAKNYYIVLGIPQTESPRGIRTAFRDLARQHHPDRAGPDGTPVFREILEAYRVLSDPRTRSEHDARLRAGRGASRAASTPVATPPRRSGRFETLDVFGEPHSIRPSADALLARLLRNFAGGGPRKGERPEPLLCDVALSGSEAHRGGILPIRIPTSSPCPRCHGAGRVAAFACADCDAAGRVPAEVSVPLTVPAGVRSGTILEMPLDAWGIGNVWLRARIRVAG